MGVFLRLLFPSLSIISVYNFAHYLSSGLRWWGILLLSITPLLTPIPSFTHLSDILYLCSLFSYPNYEYISLLGKNPRPCQHSSDCLTFLYMFTLKLSMRVLTNHCVHFHFSICYGLSYFSFRCRSYHG